MAKAKNKRLKQRVKAAVTGEKPDTAVQAAEPSSMQVDNDALSCILKRANVTDIDADFDTRSAVTSKTLRGLNLKKNEKRKLRHTVWTKKVGAIETQLKEAKAKKKRESTVVVGDMSSLLDSLPTFKLVDRTAVMSQHNKSSEHKRRQRSVETESMRKLQKLSDISLFKSVMAHPTYQANPLGAITGLLRNKLQQQEFQDDS